MKIFGSWLRITDMNEEFELQKRIASADSGRDAPELDHTVVTGASLGKPRRQFGFRGLRLGVGVGSVSLAVTAVALAVTLPAAMTPPASVHRRRRIGWQPEAELKCRGNIGYGRILGLLAGLD